MKSKRSCPLRFFPFIALFLMLFSLSCPGKRENEETSASGTIEAIEVNVASKMSGQVSRLLIDEGSQVKEGQTLALIDSSALELQLKQAEAGVELAEAQLQLLLRGARLEDIRQAEEGLRQAEANLKVAEEDLKRMVTLLEKGSATPKQKEDAEARQTVATAQHNSAKQTLLKLKQLVRPEEIKAAEARLSQAITASDLLKKYISDCTILAPISGIVTHKAIEAGEFVAPGTVVLTIANLDKVHLRIYITEPELGRVHLGQPAEVKIDSYPDRVFRGRVVYISPQAEFTPKNIQTKEERVKLVFAVKIEIQNEENILKAGMPADATIKSKALSDREVVE